MRPASWRLSCITVPLVRGRLADNARQLFWFHGECKFIFGFVAPEKVRSLLAGQLNSGVGFDKTPGLTVRQHRAHQDEIPEGLRHIRQGREDHYSYNPIYIIRRRILKKRTIPKMATKPDKISEYRCRLMMEYPRKIFIVCMFSIVPIIRERRPSPTRYNPASLGLDMFPGSFPEAISCSLAYSRNL